MESLYKFKRSYRILITFCLVVIFLSGLMLFSGRERVMKIASDIRRLTSKVNQTLYLTDAKVQKSLPSAPLEPVQKITPKAKPVKNTTKRFLLELSSIKLPPLDPEFKNPCWYTDKNRQYLRCFPYFFLAGFPKCGTTDIYYRMMAHPLIIGGKVKEPHFLTRIFYKSYSGRCEAEYHCGSTDYSNMYYKRSARMISMTGDAKSFSSLLNIGKLGQRTQLKIQFMKLFPEESLAIWKEGRKHTKYPGITVDGSALIAWDYYRYRDIAENDGLGFPRNTTADWIRRMFSGARILMSVRNPVDRSFSHYMMDHRARGNSSHFHSLVRKSVSLLKECLKNVTSPLLCTTIELPLKINIGLYYLHIKNWFEKLPRDQVLVFRFEDYTANSTKILASIFRFLGLPALSQEALKMIINASAQNVSPFKYKPKGMLPETRKLLSNFYKPYNEKLAKLMKNDIFLWNDSKPET